MEQANGFLSQKGEKTFEEKEPVGTGFRTCFETSFRDRGCVYFGRNPFVLQHKIVI